MWQAVERCLRCTGDVTSIHEGKATLRRRCRYAGAIGVVLQGRFQGRRTPRLHDAVGRVEEAEQAKSKKTRKQREDSVGLLVRDRARRR